MPRLHNIISAISLVLNRIYLPIASRGNITVKANKKILLTLKIQMKIQMENEALFPLYN